MNTSSNSRKSSERIKEMVKDNKNLIYGILVVIGLVLLYRYYTKQNQEQDELTQYDETQPFFPYTEYPFRSNCMRNIFGQTVCYPSRYVYPNYYYPYKQRHSPYAISPQYDRMHYWRRRW